MELGVQLSDAQRVLADVEERWFAGRGGRVSQSVLGRAGARRCCGFLVSQTEYGGCRARQGARLRISFALTFRNEHPVGQSTASVSFVVVLTWIVLAILTIIASGILLFTSDRH